MNVTVDLVVFTIRDEAMQLLLIKRGIAPYKDRWALPGGFIREGESLEHAARRELHEETGVEDVYLEQLYTFGEPGRDPRGRVITVAYYALIASDVAVQGGSDAAAAKWFPVDEMPSLAFDHRKIVDTAIERIRNKLEYTTVGFELLPRKFTLSALQKVYEIILGQELDKRNFRRKIELLDILIPLEEYHQDGPSRPAQLFRFNRRPVRR